MEKISGLYYYFDSKILIEDYDDCLEMLKRVTMMHSLSLVIYEGSSYEEFCEIINSCDLKYLIGKSFAIEEHFTGDSALFDARWLAKPIWEGLDSPRVNLDNPDFRFLSVSFDNLFFFSRVIYRNSKGYLERMPKLRPVARPYTLKADMARVIVNYLGIKNEEGSRRRVFDPFCGIGGILMEAFDMGFNVVGNDISTNDIKDCKINFEKFFNGYLDKEDRECRFFNEDIKVLDGKDIGRVDGIVTDIPYGRCSRKLGDDIYRDFLSLSYNVLPEKGRLVVVFSSITGDFYDLAKEYFRDVLFVEEYINKSMTRYIAIFEK